MPDLDSTPNNLGAAASWWPSEEVPDNVWAECGPNLPPCSQKTDQLYRGKFMSEHYAVYQDEAADTPWDRFVIDNDIGADNIEDNVSFFLHTTFSWAVTGAGLIRGQLVPADVSEAPEYALAGCTMQNSDADENDSAEMSFSMSMPIPTEEDSNPMASYMKDTGSDGDTGATGY